MRLTNVIKVPVYWLILQIVYAAGELQGFFMCATKWGGGMCGKAQIWENHFRSNEVSSGPALIKLYEHLQAHKS
jgi:hypothetical protein